MNRIARVQSMTLLGWIFGLSIMVWASASTADVLQYQARLTDPATGQPREGVFTVTFNIYESDTLVWTETKSVAVTNGLFTTLLGDLTPFPTSLFHGQELWLGVAVDPDEEAVPRQLIAPVAHALYAGEAGNAGELEGKEAVDFAEAKHEHDAEVVSSGVFDDARIPETIARDDEIVPNVLANDGSGSTLDADLLDGMDSADFAPAAHDHDAAAVNSGVFDEARIPDTIARDDEIPEAMLNNDGPDSGLDADMLDGLNSTDFVRTTGPTGVIGSSANPIFDVTQNGSSFAGRFTSATNHGVVGITASTNSNISGVHGIAGSAGVGVSGKHGVSGETDSGKGVVGISSTGIGTYGWSTSGTYAIRGETQNPSTTAIGGSNYATTGNAQGVWGSSLSTLGTGVSGDALATTGTAVGVKGTSASISGIGVYGRTTSETGTTYGLKGESASTTQGAAVYGNGGYVGVWANGGGWGVYGYAKNEDGYSVYGANPGSGGYAGFFAGKTHVGGALNVTGALTKGSGSFKIDHPLDPENKYLYHSFVESPDMMNVYNGNVVLDEQGEAAVTLPDWFEALNREFRYQLTAIGGPGPNLYIAQEIENNQFSIAGGTPGLKVSWQVTGIRHDPFAEAHRIPVEEEKPEKEKGTYLHPEEYGVGQDKALNQASEPIAAE